MAVGIAVPESVLCVGMPLIGGLSPPLGSFDIIASNAKATDIMKAEAVLGLRVALNGGLSVPLHSLDFIFNHATSCGVV